MTISALLKRGAEASIYLSTFANRKAVIKRREPKTYRDARLDKLIRSQRQKNEARCIAAAREAGVLTPFIFDVDMEEMEIVMEFIPGDKISSCLERMNSEARHRIEHDIGMNVAALHSNHIAHGDLTTSNMILSGSSIYIIDFSMSTRDATVENMGVDIHMLRGIFLSTHPSIAEEFSNVLEGYVKNGGKNEVIEKAKEIEGRVRYV